MGVEVSSGTAEDPGIRPAKNIFVGSKPPWFEITDDMPQRGARHIVTVGHVADRRCGCSMPGA
jgi:hypothetical protein